MTVPVESTEPAALSTKLENIVFWVASLVAVAFITLTIVKFGTVVETIHATRQEADAEQARLTSATNQLTNVQQNLAGLDNEIAKKQDDLAKISRMEQTVDGLEADIAKKQDELRAAEAMLAEKTAAIAAEDKRLADLKDQIVRAQEAANAASDEARRTLADLSSQIERRTSELNAFGERLAALRREAEQFAQRNREFCSIVRVALHAEISIVNRLRPAAEYCGLPVPASPELGPG
jgi:chromosome segregation ATPase